MKIYLIEPVGISSKEFRESLIGHDIIDFDSRGWDDEKLIEKAIDADILVLTNRIISDKVIFALNNLKMIAVAFAGIDHVDQKAAAKRNILIKNAAGYANTAVAELALGLMLALVRRIPQNNTAIRNGIATNTGSELKGKTLGVIGLGAIGNEVCRLAEAFGMNLIKYSRNADLSLEDVFASSDFISLHIPLSEENRKIISLSVLNKMKPTAFLINCARGPIVDTEALIEVLTDKKIAGAALDVFDMEPPLPDNYPLLQFDNVIATPHIGFNTQEALLTKGKMTLNNILHFLKA